MSIIDLNIQSVSKELGYAIVSGIVNDRGRDVIFNVSLGLQTCPTCAGTDPFCPTCDGNQRIHVEEQVAVKALIRWAGEGQRKYRPEGQYLEGDCTLVTIYTERDVNSAGILYSGSEFLMRRARSVLVDDRKMVIEKYMRAGKPLNRVYFICNEDDMEHDEFRVS